MQKPKQLMYTVEVDIEDARQLKSIICNASSCGLVCPNYNICKKYGYQLGLHIINPEEVIMVPDLRVDGNA